MTKGWMLWYGDLFLKFFGLGVVLLGLVLFASTLLQYFTFANLKWWLATEHAECTLNADRVLGSWVELTCKDGLLSGYVGGIVGAAEDVGDAIKSFVSFHGQDMRCQKAWGDEIDCNVAGTSLSEQLSRLGYAEPENSNATAMQAWIATVIGFSGAIVAFMWERDKERDKEKNKFSKIAAELTDLSGKISGCITRIYGSEDEDEQKALLKENEGNFKRLNSLVALAGSAISEERKRALGQAIDRASDAPNADKDLIESDLEALTEIVKDIRRMTKNDD